jgi:hypothetical protein
MVARYDMDRCAFLRPFLCRRNLCLCKRTEKASALEPKPQQPEQVAEECLRRLGTTPSFVSGTANKLVSFLMQRVFSRKKAIEIMGDGMKKMYRIVPLLL